MKFLTELHFPRAGITSSNRLALAPMTNQQSHADGCVSDEEIKWLVSRAQGGFGMIISCASHVHPGGQGWPGEMGIFADHLVDGLKHLAQGIAEAGSLGLVQLYHGGAKAPHKLIGQTPVSASSWPAGPNAPDGCRELSSEEIKELVQAFALAAERAWKAGFAGVEIHGAHGYLITQFLDREMNQRTDEYGGSVAGRARFLIEILNAVRQRVPRNFLVGVRLSPESSGASRGLILPDTLQLCDLILDCDIDFIHMSLAQFDRLPTTIEDSSQPLLTCIARHLKQRIPLLAAGGIITPEDAEKAIELGADGLALGRIAIGNPDWPRQAARPGYQPKLWPYSPSYLRGCHLGQAFIDYMRRWNDFVAAEK